MNHLQLRERLFNRPLLITSDYAAVVASVLSDRLGIEPLVSDEAAQRYVRPASSAAFDPKTGIAMFPVVGSMVHRGGGMDAPSGVQSYTSMHAKLTELIDNPKVRGILLDMDTPGGETAGLTELARWMSAAKAEKPIWAIANTSMCSAGYWLASACTRIIAAPMASVGSIGVVTMHQDVSKVMEKRGVVNTFIFAGKHKVEGNPFEPLPDDVKKRVQANIDSLYDQFAGVVAANRNLDLAAVKATEAGVFSPEQAKELGLIDGIGTLGETLEAFAGELNRATTWSATRGRYMDKEYTKDDLTSASAAAVTAAVGAATVKLSADFGAAITAMFPGAKADAFAFALSEGMSIPGAAKMAAMIPSPAVVDPVPAARAGVDRFMEQHAPNVSAEGGPSADSEEGRRAARMVELRAAGNHVRATKYGLSIK